MIFGTTNFSGYDKQGIKGCLAVKPIEKRSMTRQHRKRLPTISTEEGHSPGVGHKPQN